MGVNPETLPLGGAAPAPSRPVSYVVSIALGVLLLCSALLNVAQYTQGAAAASPGSARLGWGSFGPSTHSFARLEDPLRDGRCNNGLVHMCIDEASAASSATAAAASSALGVNSDAGASNVRISGLGVDDVGFSPGEDALEPAAGGARYCRKDTWLLSCLFYKADVNDELTDWKSVKSECDREPLCDGVNKYWTSDLWHISSSGEAPGCDQNLHDGNGTDASAFYKEGSRGWHIYNRDGSCHEVDEWGNPTM